MPSPYSYVNGAASNSTGNTSSQSVTLANVIPGNLLVIGCTAAASGVPTFTIADNSPGGNTWGKITPFALQAQTGLEYLAAFWAVITSGATSFTATVTSSIASSTYALSIDQFAVTGGSTISLDGAPATGAAFGNALSTTTVTPSGTDLIWAIGSGRNNTITWTVGAGFTLTTVFGGLGGGVLPLAPEYVLNQTAPVTPALTISGASVDNGMIALAFLATASGATFRPWIFGDQCCENGC